MGAIQLGNMAASTTSLRTPFVATVAVMLLIWSLLSLKMPPANQLVNTNKNQELNVPPQDEANRIAQESTPVASPVAAEAIAVVIPVSTPSSTDQESTQEGKQETVPPQEAVANTPTVSERPLILYAYADSDTGSALINLRFFLDHGLHGAADFIFILNGDTDVASIIPEKENIKVVKRPNDCYDLGAYAEILLANDLYKGYKRFIMMNASIRGPFVPAWSNGCWSDMYLSKITDEVKLVGMTANCWPTFHIQSMIWATDITGLTTLLFPPPNALEYLSTHPILLPPPKNKEGITSSPSPETSREHQAPGINGCFHTWDSAVAAEISSTSLMRAAGFKVDAMMNAFQGMQKYRDGKSCDENRDVLFDGEYFGTNVGVFETIFMKSNRDVDPVGLEKQSEWIKGRGYSSYDYCSA